MVDFQYQINAARVSTVLGRTNDLVRKELQRTLRDVGIFHTRRMQRRFTSYQGKSPNDRLQTRSGALRRSFGFELDGTQSLSLMAVRMFSAGVPYARTHEEGATIFPKRARYLTVPLPSVLTAAGVMRGGFKLVKLGRGRYATADGRPTFIFRSRRGNLIVATRSERQGRSARGSLRSDITPLYVLKESVRIPARLGFVDTFNNRTRRFIDARLGRAADVIEEASGRG